ncbi:MAG: aminotransferase class V-fold PLP-dependent enzyme [Acidobacteriia bacterium]|nr:aminotransferase class V-fold PLP-dependent enzyme [Terriglobia bacterium]
MERRTIFQLAGLWPFSLAGAAAKKSSAGIYAQLGIRPIINFTGTHTTIGASKVWEEVHEGMAEASRDYVELEDLQQKVGERLAKLCGTESAMVTSGAAGAIALGTYAALAGTDQAKIRRLPDLTGMKTEAVIQKAHRNGYDHAVRGAGVRIIEVETREQLDRALNPQTAIMYYLGGTSHDWETETPIPLDACLESCRKAGVPVLVDAANMLPPWGNIPKLAAQGVDLIALSGGKHMRGPQCSGILAGRKDLVRAAWLNSSPHSDSQGRPMKVGREEVVGIWMAAEKYSKLDFDAIDRQCSEQAGYLIREFTKIKGVKAEKTPFDRTRRVHRVHVSWDEAALGVTASAANKQLKAGEPRIFVAGAKPQGLEFTVFMNEPGDEKVAARRLREVLSSKS